jgi:hypothetical protein
MRNFHDVTLVVLVVGQVPDSIYATALLGAKSSYRFWQVVISGLNIPPPSTRPFKDFYGTGKAAHQ